MTEEQCRAIFTVAGLEILALWELPNGYWPKPDWQDDFTGPNGQLRLETSVNYTKLRAQVPWWLVKTKWGLIEIGWRKRVISINWKDTGIKANVTADPVIKDSFLVHADTEMKAIEYLKFLTEHFLKESNELSREAT